MKKKANSLIDGEICEYFSIEKHVFYKKQKKVKTSVASARAVFVDVLRNNKVENWSIDELAFLFGVSGRTVWYYQKKANDLFFQSPLEYSKLKKKLFSIVDESR